MKKPLYTDGSHTLTLFVAVISLDMLYLYMWAVSTHDDREIGVEWIHLPINCYIVVHCSSETSSSS